MGMDVWGWGSSVRSFPSSHPEGDYCCHYYWFPVSSHFLAVFSSSECLSLGALYLKAVPSLWKAPTPQVLSWLTPADVSLSIPSSRQPALTATTLGWFRDLCVQCSQLPELSPPAELLSPPTGSETLKGKTIAVLFPAVTPEPGTGLT